jgi:hypothetical protein
VAQRVGGAERDPDRDDVSAPANGNARGAACSSPGSRMYTMPSMTPNASSPPKAKTITSAAPGIPCASVSTASVQAVVRV